VPDLFDEPEHATPLTPEEMRDLIPAYIAYRRELNEAGTGEHRTSAGLGSQPQAQPPV